MPSSVRRLAVALFATALLLTLGAACTVPRAQSAPTTASQQSITLTNAEFWRLSSEMSEPGGYFQSDNFTSNEQTFPRIVNHLRETKAPGGIYMGVGPEQNFHYIVALRPRMAFIVDIRRQAVMQHLMYKALFELSSDRADFISRLFSMPRPAALDSTSGIEAIWNAFWYGQRDSVLWTKNFAAVKTHLTRTRGIPLDTADLASLQFVYEAFYRIGPSITYNGYGNRGGGGSRPSFSTLTQLSDETNTPRSFLATEESFRVIRDMHMRNAIVPVVGDFGGPKAIRAVGAYAKAQGATVTAFYLSNVEQYLFRDAALWARFYENVATLPLDSTSLFIRPQTGGGGVVSVRGLGGTGPVIVYGGGGPPGATLSITPLRGEVCPMVAFLKSVNEGRVRSFNDARACRL
jgi:hypothetical protein